MFIRFLGYHLLGVRMPAVVYSVSIIEPTVWGRCKDPVYFAELIGKALEVDLTCEKYKHGQPCGPLRDAGPRYEPAESPVGRWHVCWRVIWEGIQVASGRRQEIVSFLEEFVEQAFNESC